MPETLVDAQAAAEKRVHALAGSLRTALAPIQEQLDNPVPGAHCSCLKPRMFNEFGDTEKDAEKECRLFCEERLDWADAQRQRLCRELLEDRLARRQRPAPDGGGERRHPGLANLVASEVQLLQLWHRALPPHHLRQQVPARRAERVVVHHGGQ